MYKEITKQLLSVKLFASLRQAMNSDNVSVEIQEPITILQLKEIILKNHPKLKELNIPFFVNVNYEFAKDSTIIKSTDEVALIPPVSGG